MNRKIVITGATGLIGQRLSSALTNRGDEIFIFTRDTEKAKKIIPNAADYIEWDYNAPYKWEQHLDGKDAVIHLAGANLFGKRWTDDYKKIIMGSRKYSTNNLVDAMRKSNKKPEIFICASAVGYYGDSGDKELTESAPPGKDFLAEVCRTWEEEASKAENFGIRRVSIRTGVVLSLEEGALKEMLTPFKMFVGGPLGDGNQWFPWIHVDDIVGVYLNALENPTMSGAVNASSPNPVKMKEFAKVLGEVLDRPSLFKVPEIALKIAVGEVAETITASLRVIPEKLLKLNYQFRFLNLKTALENLVNK